MPLPLKPHSTKLFTYTGFSPARLIVYGLIAVFLMVLDQRGSYNEKVRQSLATLALPIQYLAHTPSRVFSLIGDSLRKQSSLLDENQLLQENLLSQKVKLQRQQTLENENQRLRSLLGARTSLTEQTLVVELLAIDLDPFSHRVVIDRGSEDDVQTGMVMLDASGVMGQVDVVTPSSSEVILISDPSHALPVEVARTGLRSIAFGTGDSAVLMLPNVTINADIKRGDLLITSGLGSRFPAGYPVAKVMSVERDEGRTFARVWALPLAHLDRTREALLLNLVPAETEIDEGTSAEPATEAPQ